MAVEQKERERVLSPLLRKEVTDTKPKDNQLPPFLWRVERGRAGGQLALKDIDGFISN